MHCSPIDLDGSTNRAKLPNLSEREAPLVANFFKFYKGFNVSVKRHRCFAPWITAIYLCTCVDAMTCCVDRHGEVRCSSVQAVVALPAFE